MDNHTKKTNKSSLKIWIGTVLAVMLLSLILSACGKKSDDVNGKDEPSNKNTELTGTDDPSNKETEEENTESEDAESEGTESGDADNKDTEEDEVESNHTNQEEKEDDEYTEDSQSSAESENKKPTDSSNSSNSQTSGESTQNPTDTEDESSTTEENTDQKPEDSKNQETPSTTKEYTVKVFSQGGHQFYNVKISVYADETMKELVAMASTNRSGKAALELDPGKDYVFTLSNVPKGYQVSDSYSFSGRNALVILNSSLVTEENLSGDTLKVGDVMYDITLSGAKGEEITLSEVLKKKEMVMINFWYVNCTFCVKEFPAMSAAYHQFKDDIEIIAVTPFDSMDAVQTFLMETPLPFEVATCPLSLPENLGVSAYPVSVIIDKYGVIREIETGAILEENGFITLFDKYN